MDHGLPVDLRELHASPAAEAADEARHVVKFPSDAAAPITDTFQRRAGGNVAMRTRSVLQRAEWARQLELEKRRADRSKAPLSVALFRLEPIGADDQPFADLIDLLCRNKRETDFVGCVDDSLVAALLPDTTEHGARRFIAKVARESVAPRFAARVETYPDRSLLTIKNDELRLQPRSETAMPAIDRAGAKLVKRAVDLCGALIGLVVIAPVLVVVALAVKADSPGPIFYRQTRLGRGGKPFVFYKFRSMYRDADERVHRKYVTSLISGGAAGSARMPWSKLDGDARITRVGRVLRKTCLDELPQLFNVLRGELSLVGPRPPLPYEAEAYESWHLRRVLEAKPGITGLWQVSGGNVATFDDMVRMDLRYVRRWSLLLDFRILIKTVGLVLRRRGGG
jgi:lipopolysaccharide/colanic/teichoic acid biosynthesis glycosyltransferase